jgi:hypothetical protein
LEWTLAMLEGQHLTPEYRSPRSTCNCMEYSWIINGIFMAYYWKNRIMTYPLVMTNIAMENYPFIIDGLPIKHVDFTNGKLLVITRW